MITAKWFMKQDRYTTFSGEIVPDEAFKQMLADLVCKCLGHDEPEAFMEDEHVLFRCQRCKAIQIV